MRDRFLQQEVWERMGVDRRRTSCRCVLADPTPRDVPARCCSRRSCRTARSSACSTRDDGWLRDRFTEIGVIQFEDWVDTGEEYGAFGLDQEAPAPPPDRAACRSVRRRTAAQ